MCKFANYDSEKDRYDCQIIKDECLFILPDKKTCDLIFEDNSYEKK